jgi:hypothetical protein
MAVIHVVAFAGSSAPGSRALVRVAAYLVEVETVTVTQCCATCGSAHSPSRHASAPTSAVCHSQGFEDGNNNSVPPAPAKKRRRIDVSGAGTVEQGRAVGPMEGAPEAKVCSPLSHGHVISGPPYDQTTLSYGLLSKVALSSVPATPSERSCRFVQHSCARSAGRRLPSPLRPSLRLCALRRDARMLQSRRQLQLTSRRGTDLQLGRQQRLATA